MNKNFFHKRVFSGIPISSVTNTHENKILSNSNFSFKSIETYLNSNKSKGKTK